MKDCKGSYCSAYPSTHSVECLSETAREQGWYDDFKKYADTVNPLIRADNG